MVLQDGLKHTSKGLHFQQSECISMHVFSIFEMIQNASYIHHIDLVWLQSAWIIFTKIALHSNGWILGETFGNNHLVFLAAQRKYVMFVLGHSKTTKVKNHISFAH